MRLKNVNSSEINKRTYELANQFNGGSIYVALDSIINIDYTSITEYIISAHALKTTYNIINVQDGSSSNIKLPNAALNEGLIINIKYTEQNNTGSIRLLSEGGDIEDTLGGYVLSTHGITVSLCTRIMFQSDGTNWQMIQYSTN